MASPTAIRQGSQGLGVAVATTGTAPRDHRRPASLVMAVLDIVERMSSEGADLELEAGMAQPVTGATRRRP